ncbi:hypothetical protein IMPR6_260064 [Imperialibacter sp. EC-SDR9]|nr:hypothetical protein IMPERIA75_320064 [Imperialibacter sp. 75]CAD5292122.1 hypothetical protein IMPERIA89_630008 [Imperialibacter sp. 89]VVT18000.1 hypothetical protein IMPR6_260064 [Imperialibacter sp. EC-SDR9]
MHQILKLKKMLILSFETELKRIQIQFYESQNDLRPFGSLCCKANLGSV